MLQKAPASLFHPLPLSSTPLVELLLCDEFRLLYATALMAAAIAGASRFINRRLDTDWPDRAADIALLVFIIQYLAVGLPGMLGILSPVTIALSTIALSAGFFFAPCRAHRAAISKPPSALPTASPILPKLDRRIIIACILFAAGYLGGMIVHQAPAPVLANDAHTYHFPAAVRWLQTGRIGLYETWFFNPANTYSPLAGSTFIAWWLAPLGNDILAKFAQFPALALVFFATLRLARAMGIRAGAAGNLALGLILSQPFVRQAFIEKDDLYLAAFFAAAFAAIAPERMKDRLAPWRVGAAIGMALATKYTALMMLPLMLLAMDAPFRAKWKFRQYAIALPIPLLLAGPWFIRNALLTGNPLFPLNIRLFGHTIFPGILTTAPSLDLRSPASVWSILTRHDQSMPIIPTIALLLGLTAAYAGAIAWRAAILRAPRIRICLAGPPIAIAIFVLTSPYPEARFIYPALVLLAGALAVAINAWARHAIAQLIAAGVFALACILTGLSIEWIGMFSAIALAVALLGGGALWLLGLPKQYRRRVIAYETAMLLSGLAIWIYVSFSAAIKAEHSIALLAWRMPYGQSADLWQFIRDKLPPTEPLAYTNSTYTYAMTGSDLRRPVVYVPTRHNIRHLHDLPPLPGELPGERIPSQATLATFADPDPDQWLARLSESGATHIAVFINDTVPTPPELAIIQAHPEKFRALYSNPAGTVYEISR